MTIFNIFSAPKKIAAGFEIIADDLMPENLVAFTTDKTMFVLDISSGSFKEIERDDILRLRDRIKIKLERE